MKENYFLDDGAYLVTKIIIKMAQLRSEGKKLDSLIADLKEPVETKEVRIKITEKNFRAYGEKVITELTKYAKTQKTFKLADDNYEGVRVSFDKDNGNGWFLLRLSVHDPIMPLNIESDVKGGVEKIYKKLLPFLEDCEGLDTYVKKAAPKKPAAKADAKKTAAPAAKADAKKAAEPVAAKADEKKTAAPVAAKADEKKTAAPVAAKADEKKAAEPVAAKADEKKAAEPAAAKADDKKDAAPVDVKADDKKAAEPAAAKADDKKDAEPVAAKAEVKAAEPAAKPEEKTTAKPAAKKGKKSNKSKK